MILKCLECGIELNDLESKEWYEGPRCCDGYMCGCQGMPIDPPYCDKCVQKGIELYSARNLTNNQIKGA